MKVKEIHYNEHFQKMFRKLPKKIQEKSCRIEVLFRNSPFYPSLRLHKLSGKLKDLWSISVDRKYRIVFEAMEDGNILFMSIGLHAIYD